MSERYFGKVVRIIDEYAVVINKGTDDGVKTGQKFLIVCLGEIITDPDTNEELEQLEIVRGRVIVTHVQQKIATLKSLEYEKSPDVREIKKVTSLRDFAMLGPRETVTESITPGEQHLKSIAETKIGDLVIKIQ